MAVAEIADAPLLQPAGKFTDEMALDWLSANPNTTKTMREIAVVWGWHRSRVFRFLSRFRETNSETSALSRDTNSETEPLSRETSETSETNGETSADFDFKQSEAILPPRTSVYAYIEQDTGDLRIHASDAAFQCDAEIRINCEDVEIFIYRLLGLYEDWQKTRGSDDERPA